MTAATTRTELDDLDADIHLAWLEVLEARARWEHSPNGETIAAERTAVAVMDELLLLRHAVDPHELPADVLERLGLS